MIFAMAVSKNPNEENSGKMSKTFDIFVELKCPFSAGCKNTSQVAATTAFAENADRYQLKKK